MYTDSEQYGYTSTVYYVPAKKFSDREKKELGISILVLTIALTLAYSHFTKTGNLQVFIFYLPISFLVISTAFVLHELGHKFLAQKYGCWAEFRMYTPGLLIALLLSFFGTLLAVPGAVQIVGNISQEEYGKISLAGPSVNILISLFVIPLLFISGIIRTIGFYVGYINIILAMFNMIPFPPLDGSKIIRWNKKIYIFAILISFSIFVMYHVINTIR